MVCVILIKLYDQMTNDDHDSADDDDDDNDEVVENGDGSGKIPVIGNHSDKEVGGALRVSPAEQSGHRRAESAANC